MKIGIMSDSHGRHLLVRKAVQRLDAAGVDAFIHCGDVGGLDVLDELAGRRCWFVWGNTDMPEPSWKAHLAALGLPWPDGPLDLKLGGRKVAVYHGHERGFAAELREPTHDYVLYGHTHRAADDRENGVRIINPGALHRTSVRTVALLDLRTDELEFIDIDTASE